ncbi:MAG: VWA domain-containing protein [Acidobacteriota bacterium]
MNTQRITWLVAILLAFVAAAACAQEDAPSEDPIDLMLGEVVDVNVVNLEVYVTDKKGNRVTGLTKDDFILEHSGRPVAITNFYEVRDGGVQGDLDLDLIDVPDLPGREKRAVPEDQRLHLVVYVDNFNLHPFSRNRVFGHLRTFLRTRLRTGDKVMLVTYDRSLKQRVPFTGDPEIIASTLYDLEEISAHAVHHSSDRRDILDAIYNAENAIDVQGRAYTYVEGRFNDLSFSITALKEIVEGLAGLPGRKALMYISDGVDLRAGEDIFYAMSDAFGETSYIMESFRYDLTRRYQELTAQANANRVTFYSLDAAGLRTYSYIDVRNQTAGGGAQIDQTYFHNIQAPLRLIADETGGRAVMNTNNWTPMLERIAEDFDNYYSIGYSPASAGSGRYHRLDVKVKERWLRVRHREGYRDKSVERRMSESTLATLHYGYQRNDLDVALEFGRPTPDRNGHYSVPLAIRVPMDKINFLPQEEMNRGRLRLTIAARDDDGGMSEVQDVTVPIDVPATDEQQQSHWEYVINLQLRGGRMLVAVGVRDEIGAIDAYVSRGLNVGS